MTEHDISRKADLDLKMKVSYLIERGVMIYVELWAKQKSDIFVCQ